MLAALSRDPTRTLALRTRFRQALSGRLLHIRLTLVQRLWGTTAATGRVFGHQEPPPEDEESFLRWASALIVGALLPIERWWERFVRQAYRVAQRRVRGPRFGLVAGPGVSPVLPRFQPTSPALRQLLLLVAARLEALATQTTLAVREAVSRAVLQGTPATVAAIRAAFPPLLRRGELLTDTTIVGAHATGTLDALEQAGVPTVTPEIEGVRFTTRGDDRVCSVCRALSGRVYTIAAARGVIPLHARCRCRWTPVRQAA